MRKLQIVLCIRSRYNLKFGKNSLTSKMAALLQPPEKLNLRTLSNVSSSWSSSGRNVKLWNYLWYKWLWSQDMNCNISLSCWQQALEKFNGFLWSENEDNEKFECILATIDQDRSTLVSACEYAYEPIFTTQCAKQNYIARQINGNLDSEISTDHLKEEMI